MRNIPPQQHTIPSAHHHPTQEDRLEDLQRQYAELKQQNEELEACFEEALAEAKKLQDENQRLQEEHKQALLQVYVWWVMCGGCHVVVVMWWLM